MKHSNSKLSESSSDMSAHIVEVEHDDEEWKVERSEKPLEAHARNKALTKKNG